MYQSEVSLQGYNMEFIINYIQNTDILI